MTGVGIGEAARRVGLAPSAVRFYEREGLLGTVPQPGGRRRYDDEALRRLAFVALSRELGLDLAAIRSVLDPAPGEWAPAVDAQIAVLDERIDRMRRTREFLAQGRDCPSSDPLRDCPHLRGELDRVLAR
jgi:MerR family transcriptional regulator, redox-sensitive transcriptional activator SoxR